MSLRYGKGEKQLALADVYTNSTANIVFFFSCGGVRQSTWYVGHYLVYCTSPGWWMMMSEEQSVEWVEGETYVLGGNLSHCRLVHRKTHMI
jgi:hypothetical protein